MLIIREIFHCKPGQVRPLLEKFKAVNKVAEKMGMGPAPRLMTDLSGENYWTIVQEFEVKNLADFEEMFTKFMGNKELGEAMKGYHDFVVSGRREIFKIEA